MIGSAIAEYNVAISYELHWLFLLDFKWSFMLVYVWLISPGSNTISNTNNIPPYYSSTLTPTKEQVLVYHFQYHPYRKY